MSTGYRIIQKRPLTRRRFLKAAAGAAVMTALPGILRPKRASASVDLEVGVIAPSHCAAPYFVSAVSGKFAQAGIGVKVTPYADMKQAAGDLLRGKIQAAQLTVPLFLAIRAGKGPVDAPKPVQATQITGTEGGAIVVRKGSDARRLEDLEGMRIASHTPFTVHYLILATLMERKNFSRESIRNILIRPLSETVGDLASGDIDAFIMPEPVNSLAVAKGAGDIFVRTRMLWPGHPCCLTASTEGFLSREAELYQAFTDVLVRTCLEMDDPSTRPEMLSHLKSAEPYGKLPPRVLATAFSAEVSGFFPYPFASSFAAATTMMRERGLLEAASPAGDESGLITGFVEEAMRKAGADVPDPFRPEKVAGRVLA